MNPSDNAMAPLRDALLYGRNPVESLPDSVNELQRMLGATQECHERHCLWSKLRELGVKPSATEAGEIFGVFGEIGMPNGSALVFGLTDGSASMYTSTGGGVIGGGGHESVREACSQVIEVARPLMGTIPVMADFPYPQPDDVRLGVLTAGGVHAVDTSEQQLSSGQHTLSPLFMAWNELVTQLRLTDPAQRRAAAAQAVGAYVNCLLTLMWEKSLSPITIPDGGPLPDLRQMATSLDDHKFIDEIGFPPNECDPDAVRSILLNIAGFKWFRFFKKNGEFRAQMATSPEKRVDVCFIVEKQSNGIIVRQGS